MVWHYVLLPQQQSDFMWLMYSGQQDIDEKLPLEEPTLWEVHMLIIEMLRFVGFGKAYERSWAIIRWCYLITATGIYWAEQSLWQQEYQFFWAESMLSISHKGERSCKWKLFASVLSVSSEVWKSRGWHHIVDRSVFWCMTFPSSNYWLFLETQEDSYISFGQLCYCVSFSVLLLLILTVCHFVCSQYFIF